MEVMEEMVALVFLLLVLRLILEALEWAQQLIPNLLFTMMSNQENFHQTKVCLYVQTVFSARIHQKNFMAHNIEEY